MNKIFLLICVVFLASGACAPEKKQAVESEPDYPARVETVEGVKTIFNPDYPRDGRFEYDFIEEASIGSSDPAVESVINRPADLRVDPSGFIYVMDWGDTNIKVFDPEGQLIRTLSRKGQGPGEMTRAGAFDIAGDGRIFIFDGMGRKIFALDKDGNQLLEFKVAGYGSHIECGPNDDLFYSITISPEINVIGEWQITQNRQHLYHVDHQGNILHDIGEVPGVKMKVKRENRQTMVGMTPREAHTTVWMVGPNGILYKGYSDRYQMSAYDADEAPSFRFGREFQPIKYPFYKIGGAMPEFYPAFSSRNNCFDDEGNLWLRQYTGEEEGQPAYDVFSPDGIYIRRAEVPHPLWRIRRRRAYSIIRDEEEYLYIKKFRMVEMKDGESE